MKRILAILGISVLVSACGGASTEDLAQDLTDEISESGIFSDAEAKCYAEEIVDSLGADRVEEIGIQELSNEGSELTSDEEAELVKAAASCITE